MKSSTTLRRMIRERFLVSLFVAALTSKSRFFTGLHVLFTCFTILLFTNPAIAFKPWNHDYIIKHGLRQVKVVTPDGEELRFSDTAIEEIQDATRSVDFVVGGLREFWKSELHCDDELLVKCSEVLIEYKEDRIVAQADRASPKILRETLGRALHTLQDFYSHSNWVNSLPGPGHTIPNEKLGKEIIQPLCAGVSTCQEIWLIGSKVQEKQK